MSTAENANGRRRETLPLPEAATHLLEECRMVLPGIQALFGFQLIAVFNSSFQEKLSSVEQILHLSAIALIAIAVAAVMTPAAYHRQTGPEEITEEFIVLATRLLLVGMLPLAMAICLDFYLIARLILEQKLISGLLASALFAFFISLWFLFPRLRSLPDIGVR